MHVRIWHETTRFVYWVQSSSIHVAIVFLVYFNSVAIMSPRYYDPA